MGEKEKKKNSAHTLSSIATRPPSISRSRWAAAPAFPGPRPRPWRFSVRLYFDPLVLACCSDGIKSEINKHKGDAFFANELSGAIKPLFLFSLFDSPSLTSPNDDQKTTKQPTSASTPCPCPSPPRSPSAPSTPPGSQNRSP